ncbi:MAG: PLP-dependent aminotransferase family protein [Actinomycetota bacterium]
MLELQLDLPDGRGRRAALEAALRTAIRAGRLRAGAPLPSTRVLAADLGVSRSTVVAAFEQLAAEGYLNAKQGSATSVAAVATPAATDAEIDVFGPTPRHDFRPGEPDGSSFPRARWLRSVRRVLSEAPDRAIGYPDPRGVPVLRSVLADYLARTRTVVADRSALRIVGGYSAGLGFVADALRHRGVTRIATEDPVLPIHTDILRATGLETVPVHLDAEGIDVRQLARNDVGAVVVTPAHQYPTGVTMSPERRAELIAWSRRNDAWIIEDDYDGEYRHDRRPIGAMQGLAPDSVVYAGTASKSLSPALRIAWLVVPEALQGDLLRVTNMRAGVSAIDQLALADFVDHGELDRHVRQMRRRYRRRSDALRSVLDEVAPWLELGDGAAGLHLMARLTNAGIDEATVLTAADRASVGLFGLTTHHRSSAAGSGFAIGFSRPAEHHFPVALEHLADLLASIQPTSHTAR